MKTRLITVLTTLGLLTLVASALDVAQGRLPLPLARVAEATTTCPNGPSDFFGCLLTGSRAYGWRVQNNTTGTDASAIVGQITSTSPGTRSAGVVGINNGTTTEGYGVLGTHAGGGYGVIGKTVSGKGVYGHATAGTGVYGRHTATTGTTPGVQGDTSSRAGEAVGVLGRVTSTSAGSYSAGVHGHNAGTGVNGSGVAGSHAGSGWGVYGTNGLGNFGGLATDIAGVEGEVRLAPAGAAGVYGNSALADGTGVLGEANKGSEAYGVWGKSTNGWAGYFTGKVRVTGNLQVDGNIVDATDHPLDPANQYLYHAAVESSERKNVYDGVATLDANGEAVIELPAWFEALNGDFRYQLTTIGAPALVYIAEKIQGNRFKIAGGAPGMEVSWMVTGIRRDAYAQAHPFQVEVPKPEAERGFYVHPELHGQPEEQGIEWATHGEMMRELRTRSENALGGGTAP